LKNNPSSTQRRRKRCFNFAKRVKVPWWSRAVSFSRNPRVSFAFLLLSKHHQTTTH
jgi:hypothetical protein